MNNSKKIFTTKTKIFIVIAIIILCTVTLDYSNFVKISWDLVGGVFIGLLKPDWSFVYNGSGEDLLSLLFITICIAYLGTVIAAIIALPISMLASNNLIKFNKYIPKSTKIFLNVLRAFPELVYAIIFVKVVGPGPFAGVMAIGVHQIGMLGKLFTEEFEAMDESLTEGMSAVGANFWQTLFYNRFPQLLPILSSLTLNHFEIAIRSAATLGLVGAGGIGAQLIFAIQARNWDRVSIILIGVIITVYLLDILTGEIRKRLQ